MAEISLSRIFVHYYRLFWRCQPFEFENLETLSCALPPPLPPPKKKPPTINTNQLSPQTLT